MSAHIKSWLALGDSYTCGEGIPVFESYPYQTMQLLRRQKQKWHAPEIVAKTGWTSFELADYLIHHQLEERYDFVSLLVGVNNQYRGLATADFEEEYDFLIKKALHLADGKKQNVVAISIPDWTLTPFAKKDAGIAERHAVTAFNEVCAELATRNGISFLDLRAHSDIKPIAATLLAADGLHYSGEMYARWALQLADYMVDQAV